MASRWTDDDRKRAIAVVRRHGLREAVRRTGVPRSTLQAWASAAGIDMAATGQTRAATEASAARAARLRAGLKVKLLRRIDQLLDRMDKPYVEFKGSDGRQVTYPRPPAAAGRDYAVSIGVLIDKYRLETGEATTRSEHRDLTDIFDDHETKALVEAARQYLAGDAAGEGPPLAEESAVEDPAAREPGTA